MSREEQLARSYRIRAEELRTIADMDDHIHTREVLMRVAKDYDRMAENMEAIERSNKRLGKIRDSH
jgi:hypothetical protein